MKNAPKVCAKECIQQWEIEIVENKCIIRELHIRIRSQCLRRHLDEEYFYIVLRIVEAN